MKKLVKKTAFFSAMIPFFAAVPAVALPTAANAYEPPVICAPADYWCELCKRTQIC